MKPVRFQLSRRKGSRLPPNTVKVDRTTKWGNPFPSFGRNHAGRAEAVRLFRQWLDTCLPGQDLANAARIELRGKNLACWCPAGPCHADVLLEVANA